MRACLKTDVSTVVQFLYEGDIDGLEAIAAAHEMGLSTNGGQSKLWEIETIYGWKIVEHGSWVLYRGAYAYKVARDCDVVTFE